MTDQTSKSPGSEAERDSVVETTGDTTGSEKIQKADPKLRRKMLVILGLMCLLSVGGVLALDSYLGHLGEMSQNSLGEAARKTFLVAKVVLSAVSLGSILMASYLSLLAAKILRHKRFPPPDTRVISDTKILRGLRAKAYGWTSLVFALLLLVFGLLLPLRAQKVLERQLDPSLRPIHQSFDDLGLSPW